MFLKRSLFQFVSLLTAFLATPAFAELDSLAAEEPAPSETPQPPASEGVPVAPIASPSEEVEFLEKAANEDLPTISEGRRTQPSTWDVRELLTVRAAFDAAYTSGSPSNQGFSIPLVRLGVLGSLDRRARYRLSIGQTREFASLLLSQMMPVEAFMDIGEKDPLPGQLNWRIGLFTPTSHPWWSEELMELPIPDYQESHRGVLLSRDVGTELSYFLSQDGARIGVGAFNGSGIFGLNTNNAHAFNGFVRVPFYMNGARFELGAAGSTLQQSSPGAINYRSQWSGSFYALVKWEQYGATLGIDFVTGESQDNFILYNPTGGGLTAFLSIQPWMEAYLRLETLSVSPLDGRRMSRIQVGPVLNLEPGIRIFAYFEYAERGSASAENLFQVRARLAL